MQVTHLGVVLVALILTIGSHVAGSTLVVTNMNGQRRTPMIFEFMNSTTADTTLFSTGQEILEFSSNAVINTHDNTYTYVSLMFQYLNQINLTSGEFINIAKSQPPQLSVVEKGDGAPYLAYDTVWNTLFAIVGNTRDPYVVSVDPVTGLCTDYGITLTGMKMSIPNLFNVPDYYNAGHVWYVWDNSGNLVKIDMQARSFDVYTVEPRTYPTISLGVYVDQNSGKVYANGAQSATNYAIFELIFESSSLITYQLVYEFSQGTSQCGLVCYYFMAGTFDSDAQVIYLLAAQGREIHAPIDLLSVNVKTGQMTSIGKPPPVFYMWLLVKPE